MIRMMLMLCAATAAVACVARDLEKELWFFADFDRPAQIAGGEFPMEPAASVLLVQPRRRLLLRAGHGLHPSQAGYRKWAARLKPLLDQAL